MIVLRLGITALRLSTCRVSGVSQRSSVMRWRAKRMPARAYCKVDVARRRMAVSRLSSVCSTALQEA